MVNSEKRNESLLETQNKLIAKCEALIIRLNRLRALEPLTPGQLSNLDESIFRLFMLTKGIDRIPNHYGSDCFYSLILDVEVIYWQCWRIIKNFQQLRLWPGIEEEDKN